MSPRIFEKGSHSEPVDPERLDDHLNTPGEASKDTSDEQIRAWPAIRGSKQLSMQNLIPPFETKNLLDLLGPRIEPSSLADGIILDNIDSTQPDDMSMKPHHGITETTHGGSVITGEPGQHKSRDIFAFQLGDSVSPNAEKNGWWVFPKPNYMVFPVQEGEFRPAEAFTAAEVSSIFSLWLEHPDWNDGDLTEAFNTLCAGKTLGVHAPQYGFTSYAVPYRSLEEISWLLNEMTKHVNPSTSIPNNDKNIATEDETPQLVLEGIEHGQSEMEESNIAALLSFNHATPSPQNHSASADHNDTRIAAEIHQPVAQGTKRSRIIMEESEPTALPASKRADLSPASYPTPAQTPPVPPAFLHTHSYDIVPGLPLPTMPAATFSPPGNTTTPLPPLAKRSTASSPPRNHGAMPPIPPSMAPVFPSSPPPHNPNLHASSHLPSSFVPTTSDIANTPPLISSIYLPKALHTPKIALGGQKWQLAERKMLFNVIQANPGVKYAEITRIYNLNVPDRPRTEGAVKGRAGEWVEIRNLREAQMRRLRAQKDAQWRRERT